MVKASLGSIALVIGLTAIAEAQHRQMPPDGMIPLEQFSQPPRRPRLEPQNDSRTKPRRPHTEPRDDFPPDLRHPPRRPPRRPPPDVVIEVQEFPPDVPQEDFERPRRRPADPPVSKQKKQKPKTVAPKAIAEPAVPTIPPGEIRIARPGDVSTDKALQRLQTNSDPSHVFIVGQDGFVRTYDIRTGGLVLSTVAFTDDEWASFTPEGFFEGSERGPDSLLLGTRGLPARFADIFMALFRPDLVRERMLGDPRGLVQQAAAEMNFQRLVDSGPPPRVSIRKPKTAVVNAEAFTAEIDLADLGGGAGQIEWRVNGVTLGVDRIDRTPGINIPQRLTRTFLLEPGENRIEVLAYNGPDLVASQPAAVTVTRRAPASSGGPTLHVIAVGVNDYADARLKLDFAVPDARAISGAFKAGQPKVEITPVENRDVTEANLERVFTQAGKKMRPGDVFMFFAAGHGKTLDGRYYFVPQDMNYDGDTSLRAQGVTQEAFQSWFAKIPARKSLLVYDTCESGTLTGDALQTQNLAQGTAAQKLARATGRTILSASSGAALEGYRGHGVLTYALLDALGSGDADASGTISVSELTSFVGAKVPEISFEAFKVKQIPQVRLTGADFQLSKTTATLSAGAPP